MIYAPFYTFTRPADTTQYAAGDLIANSTTAGSVTPLSWGINAYGRYGRVIGVRFYKSNKTVTAASFKVHLFQQTPGTPTNGDNGAIVVASAADYLDSVSIDLSSGGFAGGTTGSYKRAGSLSVPFWYGTQNSKLYGLIEAVGTYTPASAETITVSLEIEVVA